jgi:hypothetical protein
MQGRKDDYGKPAWHLLPFAALGEIVKVLTWGVQKYEENNWQHVENLRKRYLSACFRHLAAWAEGETDDPESGYSHLAHAGANILFLLWGECEQRNITSDR